MELRLSGSWASPPSGVDVDPGRYVNAGLGWDRDGAARLAAGLDAGVALSDERGDWISGYAGIGTGRALTPELTLDLSLAARAFSVRSPDRYRAAELRVEPEVRGRWPGGGWGVRAVGGAAGVTWGPEESEVDTEVWTGGGGVSLHHALGRLRLALDAELLESDVGAWTALGAGATARLGGGVEAGTVRVDVRSWDTPVTGGEVAVAVRVEVPLGPGVRALGSGGRSEPDPLLGTPPADYASLGVTVDVVGLLDPPDPPVARVLGGSEGGSPRTVRFTVSPPTEGTVELLGDFSGWEPVRLTRSAGRWMIELRLEPGLYHFGFRVDGRWWVPEAAPGRTEDEWGRPTATLVVPSA